MRRFADWVGEIQPEDAASPSDSQAVGPVGPDSNVDRRRPNSSFCLTLTRSSDRWASAHRSEDAAHQIEPFAPLAAPATLRTDSPGPPPATERSGRREVRQQHAITEKAHHRLASRIRKATAYARESEVAQASLVVQGHRQHSRVHKPSSAKPLAHYRMRWSWA